MRHAFDSSSGLSTMVRVLVACVITATLFTTVAVGLTGADEQSPLASVPVEAGLA